MRDPVALLGSALVTSNRPDFKVVWGKDIYSDIKITRNLVKCVKTHDGVSTNLSYPITVDEYRYLTTCYDEYLRNISH